MIRRYRASGFPDPDGDMAALSCGHYVYAPKTDMAGEHNVPCGECAAEDEQTLSQHEEGPR